MGIAYRILPDPGITIVSWHKDVSAETFLHHVLRIVNDPAWPPPAGLQLADMMTMFDPATLGNDYVHSVSELYADYLRRMSNMRVAVVASKEFHSIDAFKQFMHHYAASAHVFCSTDEACGWLGVQPAIVEPVLEELRQRIEANESRSGDQSPM